MSTPAWLNLRSASIRLTIACVALTIINGAISGSAPAVLPLVPRLVTQDLRLWQLVTWAFVGEPSVTSVIFGGLMLAISGRGLEELWGPRRMVALLVGTVTSAALVTVALGAVFRSVERTAYFGLWTQVGVMWVAYGLSVRARTISFWGLPVTGYIFAGIGAAFPVLRGLFSSWSSVVPDLLALGFAVASVYGHSPARWWERLRSFQLERALRKRSSRLRVIAGDKRNMPNDSDRYLH